MILSLSAASLFLFVLSADGQVIATHGFLFLNLLLIERFEFQISLFKPLSAQYVRRYHSAYISSGSLREYLNSRDFAIGFLLSNCL